MSASTHSRWIPALDGLRGLAILLVLAIHLSIQVRPRSDFEIFFLHAAQSGWIGVDLFFVLSGFLITGILAETKSNPHFFRHFYARRALRIFPLYYCAVIAICWLLPSLGVPAALFRPAQQLWVWLFGTNIFLAIQPADPQYLLTHFWSLAVEEHFYLFWPLLVWFFSPGAMMRVCFATIVSALVCRLAVVAVAPHSIVSFLLTPCRMDSLAIGSFMALVYREGGWHRLANILRWPGPIAFAALILIWLRHLNLDRQGDPVFQVLGYTLLATVFGWVMMWALLPSKKGKTRRFFECRPMRFFGKYSYGIYVIHWPLFVLLSRARLPEAMSQFIPTRTLTMLAFFLLEIIVVIGLAYASYQLFEKRFLDLKRWFN